MFLNPFYITRRQLFEHIRSLAPLINGRVLDIGCGQKPYSFLFKCDEYIGLEIDTAENRARKKADWFYDGKHIPAEDSSFDWIVTNEVFEHVFNPDEFLAEVYRVLKSGGGLMMTVPFVWDEHEQPYDYARYSSFGIKFILAKHGFRVVEQKKTAPDIRVIFQLINAYLYKILVTKSPVVNQLLWFFCLSPFNILGEVLHHFVPGNNDLYLDNVIVAKKESA
ncbi:MAG TPA: class I SAM-dependent methyltransferase [Paludibacter sp.]|nr:class I SAM-dependent methyltransferase [Paludibacter sp.]